jgi:hypothetical protein
MAAQKVEHYEIASYGTAIAYAKLIGEKNAAQNLQLTIDEEGKTDHDLTNLAMTLINIEAIAPEADPKGKSLVEKAIDAITGGGSKKAPAKKAPAKKATPGAKTAAKSNGAPKASMNGSAKSAGKSSPSKTAGKGKK